MVSISERYYEEEELDLCLESHRAHMESQFLL